MLGNFSLMIPAIGSALSSPLTKFANQIDGRVGGSLVGLAFGCAILGLAFVAIAFSVGGNRMRQMAKSHLIWIFVAIAIAGSIGGILHWMRASGSKDVFSTHTILPAIRAGRDQLMTILPKF